MILLLVGGPLLAFPSLLPSSMRFWGITALAVAGIGTAAWLLRVWSQGRAGFWLFAASLIVSWFTVGQPEAGPLRHFGGVALGLLAMAVVAEWGASRERLVAAAVIFAVGAIGILAIGLTGTLIFPSKFMGAVRLIPESVYFWLPKRQLGLPGLQADGHVNPNALGGTALLVLPACVGLLAAARFSPRLRWLIGVVGAIATAVGLVVLALTLSRTAWVAAMLTMVVLAARWHRRRAFVVVAVLTVSAALGYAAYRYRANMPAGFAAGAVITQQTVVTRVGIWKDAASQLRQSPWLGVGINQFHRVTPTEANAGMVEVPHAHNIFVQVAMDVGVLGLVGYLLLMVALLKTANRTAMRGAPESHIAAGAGLSIVAVHLFGLGDAIALGAKVGLFQWVCGGLILAGSRAAQSREQSR